MSCKSAFRISGGNIARSSAQERNQMLIEKLLPQWLSTMAKEHFSKRAIFPIVERFISHTPIFLPVINGIGCFWWDPDAHNSPMFVGGDCEWTNVFPLHQLKTCLTSLQLQY